MLQISEQLKCYMPICWHPWCIGSLQFNAEVKFHIYIFRKKTIFNQSKFIKWVGSQVRIIICFFFDNITCGTLIDFPAMYNLSPAR